MSDGPQLTKQLVVRIPPHLMAALQEDAWTNGRTVAQSARFLLTRSLRFDHRPAVERLLAGERDASERRGTS